MPTTHHRDVAPPRWLLGLACLQFLEHVGRHKRLLVTTLTRLSMAISSYVGQVGGYERLPVAVNDPSVAARPLFQAAYPGGRR